MVVAVLFTADVIVGVHTEEASSNNELSIYPIMIFALFVCIFLPMIYILNHKKMAIHVKKVIMKHMFFCEVPRFKNKISPLNV